MKKRNGNKGKVSRSSNPIYVALCLLLGLLAGHLLSIYPQQASPAPSSLPKTSTKEGTMTCAFNPGSGKNCADFIIDQIQNTHKEIYLFVYSFRDQKIGQALLEAKKRGVKICIIVDQKEYDKGKGTQIDRLSQVGAKVVYDGRSGYAHNKYAICDGKVVLTGSFNYDDGPSAQSYNDVICCHSKQHAQIYLTNWLENEKNIRAWQRKKKK